MTPVTVPYGLVSPTREQHEALEELALQYDSLGCIWAQPASTRVLVVACFIRDDGAGPLIEIDRFRILHTGLTLGIPPSHPAAIIEITYQED